MKKFIRAIAKARDVLPRQQGWLARDAEGASRRRDDKDAEIVWEQTHNTFGAELPKDLFHDIFESRRLTMIAAKQWAPDKPLPDPEQFLTRSLLDSTLKDMNYVPTKLDAPSN